MDGQILLPNSAAYDKLVVMRNTRVTKFPIAIALVASTSDIQKCILFARKYRLHITVQSSGHDYNGRSTEHGSFQIHLGNMTAVHINLASKRNIDGEVTCQSGTTLMNVYTEVDKYYRVFVGGNSGSVCVGGYTLGGGTSPLSRKLGLAVDNLLEVEMVTYNGTTVVANAQLTKTIDDGVIERTKNTDLFWALRGGGGGTYGIVTKYTFRLHRTVPTITSFACMYPIYRYNGELIGNKVMRKYVNLLSNMPAEWGGYLLLGGTHRKDNSIGYILIAQNYFGDTSNPGFSYMDSIKTFHPEWQIMCKYENYSSFLNYIKTSGGGSHHQEYPVNTLMRNDSFTDDWINFVISSVINANATEGTTVTATGTLLGGKSYTLHILPGVVQSVCPEYTSVHPSFRSSLMSFTMTVKWGDSDGQAMSNIHYAEDLGEKLNTFGNGMFPNNAGADVANWSREFWGRNYDRLLKVKYKWDPENIFTCRQCVGYDI
ncbi:hypothetical protein FSP39_009946 [Pinctada imbricata]|uniref:FAD-binding PCMH-type domain-containing protein n=1 Tax=Pinctada imbricata TaxID=66713 RepID=A0AA89BUD4_PINIB|nr:hypothetical protein FSP39_009946 [Pinctada imbricata]